MIQIWNQAGGKAEVSCSELRGFVEHLGSGRRESFRGERELLWFLRAEQRRPQEEAEQ